MVNVDVIILGGGPAGISSLIWLKQLGIEALLLEQSSILGGQLHHVFNPILDYPGICEGNGRELAALFAKHVDYLGCQWLTESRVEQIIPSSSGFRIVYTTKEGTTEKRAKFIISALGATQRRLHIPGEEQVVERYGSLSTTKDTSLFKDRRVVVVGGGDRAVEGVYNVMDRADSVLLVHRREQFKAKDRFLLPVLNHPRVTVKTDSELRQIIWKDGIKGVELFQKKTGAVEKYEADLVLVRIGTVANVALIRNYVQIEAGIVQTNPYGQTKTKNLYAVGDMATLPEYSSVSLSVGQGMVAAKHIWTRMQA